MVFFYFGRGAAEFGPFSPTQMRELAGFGTILPTDLVWQEGGLRKCEASKVKNLFLPVPIIPQAALTPLATAPVRALLESPNTALPRQPPPTPARQKRVIRITGGVVLSQDGSQVKFFKKCDVCKEQDPSRTTANIRSGRTSIPYFCRKCRKGRKVELFGIA